MEKTSRCSFKVKVIVIIKNKTIVFKNLPFVVVANNDITLQFHDYRIHITCQFSPDGSTIFSIRCRTSPSNCRMTWKPELASLKVIESAAIQ